MASGMDHGRVRPTTMTSHYMAEIQLIPSRAVLNYSIYHMQGKIIECWLAETEGIFP